MTGQDILAFFLSCNSGPTSSKAKILVGTIAATAATQIAASANITTLNTACQKPPSVLKDLGRSFGLKIAKPAVIP